MTKKLKVSAKLSLPIEFVTESCAILARRGAGKTYTAMVLAEEMLDAGAQVVVLDPVSRWWGLRLAADGTKSKYNIPVFGGKHGDIPLSPKSGEIVAQVVVERGISLVLDLSSFNSDAEQRRFVTDFARKLYRLKQAQEPPTPLHLMLEEAEEFLPQDQMRDQAHMIGAIKKLIKLGRNYGIGCTLVSQRSADINKKGLSQIGTLFAMQTTSPHDRKAIKEWAHGLGVQGAEVNTQVALPNLGIGEAFVWSPTYSIHKKVKIRKKRTFDTSATPKLRQRQKVEPPKLSSAALKKLETTMVEVVDEAKGNDPKELRKRIRELERELKNASKTGKTKTIEVEKIVEVGVPVTVVTPQEIEAIADAAQTILAVTKSAAKAIKRVQRGKMPFGNGKPPQRIVHTGPVQPRVVHTGPVQPQVSPARVASALGANGSNGAVKLKKGARKMLVCLAIAHPKGLTRSQLGTLAGYRGSTFSEYISIIRRHGLAEERNDRRVYITDEGIDYTGPVDQPQQTTEALVAYWNTKLKKGAREMLQRLVNIYPATLSRGELVEELDYEPSTFSEYISILRRLELVTTAGGNLCASETLFP